ncbi:MAG: biotin/lipoate A/B protein ligase family protein [Actinomycetaceae bacterium]|nr:biotin/lipoate A/B protein ligase family protein [Actinomycetaceae bacterium]
MHGEYKVPGGKLVVVDVELDDDAVATPSERKIPYADTQTNTPHGASADVVTHTATNDENRPARIESISISGDFFLDPDDALNRINAALVGMASNATAQEMTEALNSAMDPGDQLFGVDTHSIAVAVRRTLGYAVDWDDLTFDVIHGPVVHPVVNMALDQVLSEEMGAGRRGPMFRVWEWDKPLLVMGSFQSYENEINPEGIARHGIVASRRITGGGTMFMEAGNCITYSLYVPQSLVEGLSFVESYEFLDRWVMEALEVIGVKAHYVPLNDIASDQGKIGGAAQKRFSSGVLLHHVTMAYDIDAQKMLECMRIGQEKLRDKGHRSAIKRVDPMRSQTGMAREQIIQVFLDHFRRTYNCTASAVRPQELERARKLVETKFLTDEWVHRIP